MKKDKVIAIIVVLLFLTPILIIIYSPNSNNKSNISSTNANKNWRGGEKELTKKTKYEYGVELFNEKNYNSAISNFEDVEKSDSLYSDAQEYIELCKKRNIEKQVESKKKADVQEREQKLYEQQKNKLKNKYEKLMNSGLYKYQVEQRLQRDGFVLTKTKFESAPDGSTNVKSYYTAVFDGTSVRIWLQSGYSLGTYYSDVEVGY